MEQDSSAAMTPQGPKSSHKTPQEAAHLTEATTGDHHLSWSLPEYLAFPIGFMMLSATITVVCGLIIVTTIWKTGPLVTAGRIAHPEQVRAAEFHYRVHRLFIRLTFKTFVCVCINASWQCWAHSILLKISMAGGFNWSVSGKTCSLTALQNFWLK